MMSASSTQARVAAPWKIQAGHIVTVGLMRLSMKTLTWCTWGPQGELTCDWYGKGAKYFAPRIWVGWGFVHASVSTNITHAHELLRVDRTVAATTMATKSVLISYGENRRVLQVLNVFICLSLSGEIYVQQLQTMFVFNIHQTWGFCKGFVAVMRYGLGVL